MNTLNRKMFANGDEARVTETDFFGMPIFSNEISENAVPSNKYLGMNTGMYYAPPSNNEDVIQEYLKEKELDNIARREEILGSQDPTKAVNPTELIKYYVSQEYKPSVIIELLQKQFPTITQSSVLDTITSYKKSQIIKKGGIAELNALESMPEEDFTKVKGLKPNQIQFRGGEIIDFSAGLASMKNGTARTEEIYALYNTPEIKLGADVKQEIEYFLDKRAIISKDITGDDPGTEKFGTGIASNEYTINKPFGFQSLYRSGLAGAGELAREGAEKFSDYFIGQDMGDRFRGKFMGGDPDSFFLSGGRDQESIENMARSMNDPDRISTGMGFIPNYASDKISDLLSNIDTDVSISNFDALTNKLRQEANLEPIQKKIDDVSATPSATNANTEDKKTFEEQFAIDAAEARKGKFGLENVTLPEIEGIDETRKAIEKSSNLEIDSVLDEEIGKEVAEDITSEEAPKRNFAEFTRSPDFLRFVRNIGKGLTTTGQLGQGIALGAAGAAEEKYAEELLASETEADILTERAKQGGMADVSDRKNILLQQEALNENVRAYNNAVVAEDLVNEVMKFANGNDDLTSFASKVGSTVDNLMIAAKLKKGTDVTQLSDTRRAQIALDILTNANIKEILGESGRTISNIDREIATRIAGDLNMKSLQSVAELKFRLNNNVSNILEKKNEAQRNIKARVKFLAPYKDQAVFDDEILKIFFGELGQTEIPGTQLSGDRIRLLMKQ